jgi:hypothetical protein
MDTDARQPPVVKRRIVDDRLTVAIPKYRRVLAANLLDGRVPLPSAWVSPNQRTFAAMPADQEVGTELARSGRELVAAVVRLCDRVIPALIERYVALHRATLSRRELESLRRGRGPAAVRDAIFTTCAGWPSEDPDDLCEPARKAVGSALDRVLKCLRTPLPTPQVVEATFAALEPAVTAEVHRYAGRRRLTQLDLKWLVSEVLAQLWRSATLGLPPRDVVAWTWSTASRKLKSRKAIEASPVGRFTDPPRDGHDLDQVELIATLKETGKRLAKRAADLHAIGDRDNAVIHDISAAIVGSGDADVIRFFIEGGDLAELIEEHGLELSPARLAAAIALIGATLRDALLS